MSMKLDFKTLNLKLNSGRGILFYPDSCRLRNDKEHNALINPPTIISPVQFNSVFQHK
jgi:hypothetical protein